ncbi:hypothetical protein E2C01_055624 [Portunus trituberculatus]|uniref:Uncharacterized protein n=1 Tax=Portunus trituberculatus TaxID=210409 RepID=A0A5B7GRR2_PORTR|nr:hypothetical protein [Portunus trituberculatus]
MPPDQPESSRGRKRVRNPVEWKKNLAKRRRNMGEAYVSRSTGRQVQARVMRPPCADGCYDKIALPIVTVLHREFWAIGNFALQNAYIQKQVCKKPVKRHRPVQEPNEARLRSCTLEYTLAYADQTYTICKKGFLAILAVSETRVRTALKAITTTGSPREDKRGKLIPVNIISDAQLERAMQHIHKCN